MAVAGDRLALLPRVPEREVPAPLDLAPLREELALLRDDVERVLFAEVERVLFAEVERRELDGLAR